MIQYLLATLIGISFGIFTGLTPGVHINLVSVMLLSISPYLLKITNPLTIATVIIAMGITHAFLDNIPSIFLGAPDPETVMTVLPGHKLLFQGLGWDAVRLTVIGSLLCLILAIAIAPLFAIIFPPLYSLVQPYTAWILIAIIIAMISRNSNKKWAVITFLFSGALGWVVLNMNISQPLFPLLSGMFGISGLLLSLSSSTDIPPQTDKETIKLQKKDFLAIIGGALSGSIIALFPGLGPAQAAALSTIVLRTKEYTYLILTGGINTVNFIIALISVYTIDKARNGAIAVVMEIITVLDIPKLVFFAAVVLITGGIATILTLKIAKVFSKLMNKINYRYISIGIIIFILILCVALSGWIGLLVIFVSTAVGVIPQLTDCCRSNAMGCILVPVILFYLI